MLQSVGTPLMTFRSIGARGHQTLSPDGEGIRLIGNVSSILTGISPKSGAARMARLSTKWGSEAASAGIGLRISRSGVRIPPGAPAFRHACPHLVPSLRPPQDVVESRASDWSAQMPMRTAPQDQMPMGAGVASHKLVVQ